MERLNKGRILSLMSNKNLFKDPKFARIPEEDWTLAPVDSFGLQYDSVKEHGWYKNLDPTIEELTHHLKNDAYTKHEDIEKEEGQ